MVINKQEVVSKVIRGCKLTLPEFKIALQEGIFTGGDTSSDKELAKAYLYFLGMCYEDDEHYSYLCDKTLTRVIKEEKGKKTCCTWGRHMDEVKSQYLTKENLQFLRHHFGKAKVKELIGR